MKPRILLHSFIQVMLAVVLVSCATLPPPLQRYGPSLSLQERKDALADRTIHGSYWKAWHIGNGGPINYPRLFEYIGRDGGDNLKTGARWINLSRLFCALTVLAGAPFIYKDSTHWAGVTTVIAGASAMIVIDLTATKGLIAGFNVHLRNYFGLDP